MSEFEVLAYVPKGARHSYTLQLAGRLYYVGLERHEVDAIVREQNAERYEEPLEDDELERILDWVARRHEERA